MKLAQVLMVSLMVLATFCLSAYSTSICENPQSEKDVRLATEEIVKRLMRMRKSDWTWDAVITPIVFQVSVPKMFFGREKTARSFVKKIKKNFDRMSLGQKAENIIAIKSLCMNERNIGGIDLVKNVSEELKLQFPNNTRFPAIGYGMFSIGIGSVCVSGYPIENWLFEKFISGQNEDGSFGDSNHLMNTIRLLPPTHCLRLMQNPAYNVTTLDNVILKMREYIMKNIITTRAGELYIENKFLTSLALIGLWKTKSEGENPDKWRCKELSKTLGIYPDPNETLFHLTYRLMRLHGSAFLDVASPEFTCQKPDPIPKGYVPSCKPHKPWTCKSKDPDPK
ncbi:uncharacterized protein LOC120333340 [Styela clava]|uniref:uncharacterized protein LOC120333340 n=1 Tax=Styela clava TaxID=7725 RepID=UPI00193945D6|nr:uncharacterized protein LOC120333340 [Styela clava]